MDVMQETIGIEQKTKKSHILLLLLCFFVTCHFFNFTFINVHVYRLLDWLFSIILIFLTIKYVSKKQISGKVLKRWNFILIFLFAVSLSFIYCYWTSEQTISETFRVTSSWFELLFVFILYKNKFNSSELYNAVKIFSFAYFLAWFTGYLSPIPLFDASGGLKEADSLMSDARGVVRLNISGRCIVEFWGIWNLSIYLYSKKWKNLLFFLTCMTFVILSVSRQHIAAYAIVSFVFLLHKFTLVKKIILVSLVSFTFLVILPRLTIYQKLVELTEEQAEENETERENVRLEAMRFFIYDYPQSTYTIIFGHGKPHDHSDYGIAITNIKNRFGYFLSDIGFVGYYIYFGIVGLIFLAYLLIFILKSNIPKGQHGVKLYVTYVYLTSILSHNIDMSLMMIAICIYLASFRQLSPYKLRAPQNKYASST